MLNLSKQISPNQGGFKDKPIYSYLWSNLDGVAQSVIDKLVHRDLMPVWSIRTEILGRLNEQ